jgi:hypothetical protein
MNPYSQWAQRLTGAEREQAAVARLRRYFGTDGSRPYEGAEFETYGRAGDAAEVANKVTSDDLVALSLLSVPVLAKSVRGLRERADKIGNLLALIDTDLDLANVTPEEIAPESPAWQLWQVVRQVPGFGPTRTSKLLARKRPRLIPIYDSVIRKTFGSSEGQWNNLNAALREHDGAFHQQLLSLREKAGLPGSISALRVLDVVAWMEGGGPEEPDRVNEVLEERA